MPITPKVASFPFLSQLNLRSAINLSAEPLHDKAIQFFITEGVAMVREARDSPAPGDYSARCMNGMTLLSNSDLSSRPSNRSPYQPSCNPLRKAVV